MRKQNISSALILALAGTLALAGCKKKEEAVVDPNATSPAADSAPAADAPPAADAAVASAVSVSSIAVGNTAGADKAVSPLATLATSDKIIVSVKTNGAATSVPLAVKLTYQDGQTAGEQSTTLTTTGADTTNVEFAKPDGWPVGKYKAEVTVDGQPAGVPQEFEVK